MRVEIVSIQRSGALIEITLMEILTPMGIATVAEKDSPEAFMGATLEGLTQTLKRMGVQIQQDPRPK